MQNGNSHFLPSACPNDPVANKDSSYHEPQDPWIMQDKEKWSKADEDASEVENKNKLFEFDSPAVCNVTSGSLETVPEVMALGKIDVETSKAKRTNNEDVPCTSKSPQKKAPKQVYDLYFLAGLFLICLTSLPSCQYCLQR